MQNQTSFISFSDNKIIEGVNILYDTFDYRQSDNVLQIFPEEQLLAWQLYHNLIQKHSKSESSNIPFLEVGTGCGFFSINVSKTIKRTVYGIDINPRAVRFTRLNAAINQVSVNCTLNSYAPELFCSQSINVIFLNPPFHIYPKDIENEIPIFSKGGSKGQREFKKQLSIANKHISNNGVIVFIMMCLGDKLNPAYVDYFHQAVDEDFSLYFQSVFDPIETKVFLKEVYNNSYLSFQNRISDRYTHLHFTNGYILRDGSGSINRLEAAFDLPNVNWSDRIELHRQINTFNK